MRCKYTKFLYRANGCEIFFFDLTISLLTYLLEITKINQVSIALNDRFFIGKCRFARQFSCAYNTYHCLSGVHGTCGNKLETEAKVCARSVSDRFVVGGKKDTNCHVS